MKRLFVKSAVFTASIILSVATGINSAHASSVGAATGLDVNDVSFLLPLRMGAPYPILNLATEQLVSPKVFEQVLRFEHPVIPLKDLPYLDSKFVINSSKWYVTSARIDVCGEVLQLGSTVDPVAGTSIGLLSRNPGCQPRLRLVVQPFNLFGAPIATAQHFLFNLNATEFSKLANDLIALKKLAETRLSVSTTGTPLTTHPALAAEMSSGASDVGDALAAAIRTALSRSIASGTDEQLETVTMTVQTAINHWKFVGGTVRGGDWKRFVTEFSKQLNDGTDASIQMGVEELTCDIHSMCDLKPSPLVQPAVLNPAGIVVTEIFQRDMNFRRMQVAGHRDARLHTMAELIDDTHTTNFFTTNCVSCHESSNLRDREKRHYPSVLPSGITPFSTRSHTSLVTSSVINFGYLGNTGQVSSRTASESVEVADRFNRALGLQNPAASRADVEGFWVCLMKEFSFKTCL